MRGVLYVVLNTSFSWVCIRIETLAGFFSAGLAAYLVYWGGVSASNTGFALTMAGMCSLYL